MSSVVSFRRLLFLFLLLSIDFAGGTSKEEAAGKTILEEMNIDTPTKPVRTPANRANKPRGFRFDFSTMVTAPDFVYGLMDRLMCVYNVVGSAPLVVVLRLSPVC